MDELIEEFLVETKEGLEVLDNDLIELEKNPDNQEIISNLFRAMHTIKGTCGFLGLTRLEHVAHAGEDVMDQVRGGNIEATPEIVSIILKAVDHIKDLVDHLEENGEEPEGDDSELITEIKSYATGNGAVEKKQEEKPEEKPLPPSNDSAELQALFDATESLVDIGQPVKEKAQEQPIATNGDSDELQALFDATPSLVDTNQNDKNEAKSEEKKQETTTTEPKKVETKKTDAKKAPTSQTIRVSLDILEKLMQYASELVLTRNQLLQLLRDDASSPFSSALQRLNNITTELQEGVMKTRMQPVGNAWTKLPRIVRDLSVELNKKIDFQMDGEDTELDRQLLEMIGDPLTHMVRNSADHGIESPEDRLAAGKSETGTIKISAYHGGGYIIIEITDDGNGIDPEIIKKKAIEKNLVAENVADSMNKNQILQFIFAPGFSTAAQITSVSGRGVGMDVVKNNIEKISGTVELDSELGSGSKFTIRIPLTLAIMPVLKLEVQGNTFAIPQINVREVVKTGGNSQFQLESLDTSPVLRLRGRLLPLVILNKVLGLNEPEDKENSSHFVIVCELGTYSFGLIVDKVHDTEEIVVKPVSKILKSISVYSGSTILGDGSVILILDPNNLAKISGEISATSQNFNNDENEHDDDMQQSNFVLFQAGDSTPKVAPLELLSRLEEIDIKEIEHSRGVPVVQYRGELMRLVKIDPAYQIPEDGIQELLVVSDDNLYMGLIVEKIIDIVKTPVKKKISGGNDGFLGPLVIDGKTCDVIDLSYYFREVFKDKLAEEEEVRISDSKKIVLVDDSPFFRKFIPPSLEAAGFTVTTVGSGKDALSELETGQYKALVTDMTMPGISGQDLANLCRQNNKLKNLPIVALSADRNGVANFAKGKIENIDAFVAKTNHKELLKILVSTIEEKEQENG